MTKERLAEIERYLETDHEGSFSHGALTDAIAAVRERDERIMKLRGVLAAAVEHIDISDEILEEFDLTEKWHALLKETES